RDFHIFVHGLLCGVCGAFITADVFNLYVWFEVLLIGSFALISLGGGRRRLAGTMTYVVLNLVATLFFLLSAGMIYSATGTLNMADMAASLPPVADNPAVLGAMGLIVIGLSLKMALFPLHVWLPDAHSFSPPGVAALLAAVQVKAAAYALVRILYDVLGPAYLDTGGLPVATALVWFGLAGIVVGSWLAIRQTDLKRMLAYSTVAQLGYIGVGIGLASPLALVGALLHVLNHALMKSGLFLVAGGIIQQTGLKKIPRFTGLGKRMPWTMAGFAIAALSMVGIPPLAGFWSKFYLVWGALEVGNWVVAVVVSLSSLLTLVYFVRLFEQIFVREPVEQVILDAEEPGPRIVGTVGVLALAIIAVGLFNAVLVSQVLGPVATRMLG
ncbi:MAG: proton-conducting transporter membrane subunit, partial [Nitriliruptoraceae bacterium]